MNEVTGGQFADDTRDSFFDLVISMKSRDVSERKIESHCEDQRGKKHESQVVFGSNFGKSFFRF